MSYQAISVSNGCSGQLREIRLDTPPANILTAAMMAEISRELENAAAEANLKLLVISGGGQHFCYGASVQEHSPDTVGAMLPAFHRLIEQIMDHPLPTLAKVRGQCLGGGFELALACSFLFAETGSKFAVPEIQLGVFPPVAAALLPPTAAAQMILSGAPVSPVELQRAGLLTAIADPGELDADVTQYIESQILPRSASSLRIAHRALRLVQLKRFRSVIGELEALYLEDLMATHDAVEGIASFLERRQPQWSNN
jgi:cyclohexa-1,5-dienecarbonyl-CoA hydratase